MCVCVCVNVWVCVNLWVCVCMGFVMCGCFGNTYTCIYCVLYCLNYVFVLFHLGIYLFLFVTSVRTISTDWKINCSK